MPEASRQGMEREFSIDSTNQMNRLHGYVWMPDRDPEPGLIVLLAHGMVEHIERYREFAEVLNGHGIGAVGFDCLGHGKSVTSSAQLGYFAAKDGDKCLVNDLEEVRKMFKKRYPQSRFILMGHSMGSFVSRDYTVKYGKNIDGLILMGAGEPGYAAAALGICLSSLICMVKGSFYRSKFLNNLVIGQYDRYFASEEVKSWLSTDAEEVKKYEEDKLCGFLFTASAYRDFFRIIKRLSPAKEGEKIPKNLPILFVSGEDDPVGNFGKGVRKVSQKYKNAGAKHVSLRLFRGMRHELLHETNRRIVYDELLEWLDKRVDEA